MARPDEQTLARSTICFGLPAPNDVVLPGDSRFLDVLSKNYAHPETVAHQQAIALKSRACETSHDDFWNTIAVGLADLFHAQVSFVSTRVTHDRTTGNEVPPIGEKGSYLNALALYFNDGDTFQSFEREVLYKAWDCPCSGLKYGKVFIIPSDADKFTPHNPNAEFLPFELDSYIGIPLFSKGTNVGHFGLIWSKEGAVRRHLSWSFIESVLHSFDDLVLLRIMRHIEKDSLTHWRTVPIEEGEKDATSTLKSFKPHAHILSHELRTPMQGVVGMLDLVNATVQEAIESKEQTGLMDILKTLKDDITAIQDSSKRAVEATENITEAYKLDMGMPTHHVLPGSQPVLDVPTRIHAHPRARRLSGPSVDQRGVKRKYTESGSADHAGGDAYSPRHRSSSSTFDRRAELHSAVNEVALLTTNRQSNSDSGNDEVFDLWQRQSGDVLDSANSSNSGLQHCRIGELLEYVVHESFNVGGRPESISQENTSHGQTLHAVYRQTDGTTHIKYINWEIGDDVPDTIFVQERDLAKLISCVFQNAVKFTETAHINLSVDLDHVGRHVVIIVRDTGPGIQPEFRPKIFQPFTKEDNSITRRTEGLGLGLLVAKGLSGKLGGDLNLIWSETEGSKHGSEFEIRVPVFPTGISTPQTIPSAPPSVMESATGTHRRRSSASSYPLKPGTLPPFGTTLSQEQITPVASTEVSPRLGTVHEESDRLDLIDSEESPEPLTILVVEDNHINRKLLVNMLTKLGHDRNRIFEAFDGADAVKQVAELHARHKKEIRARGSSNTPPIDLVLMDIWMPNLDGYEATEKILALYTPVRRGMRRCISEPGAVPVPVKGKNGHSIAEEVASGTASFMIPPTILAVTADATDDASARAAQVGMDGFIAKPFKLKDLEKLIKEAEKKRGRNKERAAAQG